MYTTQHYCTQVNQTTRDRSSEEIIRLSLPKYILQITEDNLFRQLTIEFHLTVNVDTLWYVCCVCSLVCFIYLILGVKVVTPGFYPAHFVPVHVSTNKFIHKFPVLYIAYAAIF
jgi:hypothetical protein